MLGDLAGGIVGGGILDGRAAFAKFGGLKGLSRYGAAAAHGIGHAAVEGGIAGGFGVAAYAATGNVDTALFAANIGSMVGGPIASRLVACFVEGTRVLTWGGYRCVEDLQQTDLLAARDEHDLHAPVEFKPIEEVFIRNAHVMFVSIAGRRIGTTAEHPFYVQGRGWTPAGELALGDLVPSHDGQWNPVTALDFTGEIRRVYNFRIADHHTYFVGDEHKTFAFPA